MAQKGWTAGQSWFQCDPATPAAIVAWYVVEFLARNKHSAYRLDEILGQQWFDEVSDTTYIAVKVAMLASGRVRRRPGDLQHYWEITEVLPADKPERFVWVLMHGEGSEGGSILGVYARENDARSALEHCAEGQDAVDWSDDGNEFSADCDWWRISRRRVLEGKDK